MTLVISPTAAQANHSWGGYHWAVTSTPFTLKVGDNVSANWKSFLATTSSDWSASTVLDTKIVAGQAKRNCSATSGQVEVCNASYGSNGWLGIASISITGGTHITSGTVKLNDTYFNTAKYNTPEWRNLVSCQEVGHTLGLAHQDENFTNANLGTCMDYTNLPSTNQHPNQHDYNQLVTIYNHVHSSTTIKSVTANQAKSDVGNDSSSWGRLVSGSRASGQSTYARDLGHGNLIITHVIWA
ncbi:hypothetical protein [Cryobacterium sp. CG_9.6]|uniref:hypothetical protein n=1 Tax=Cryobacterium sp. CG_9.6 TaxID=2760710 RepID=UPI0024772A88|nr:hypothetical protein [Cryobacterium sp. CG_9.6]MDH6236091.1 hypothetical protein [Cryobacterium sp. CG_9.6]